MTQSDAILVVLVDPEERSRSTTEAAFQSSDIAYEVVAVDCLQAALEAISRRQPDFVLSVPDLSDGDVADLLPETADAADYPLVLLVDETVPVEAVDAFDSTEIFDSVIRPENAHSHIPHRVYRILEQFRTKAELREKEEFNFALFQNNPAASVVVDGEGRVLKSNLARRRLNIALPDLGAALYEPTNGKNETELAKALKTCIQKGKVREFPERQIEAVWFAITMAPLPEGAVVISHDITARKRAEAEAEERQRQLIHADKMVALGGLVSGVAHEVSNPNNAMLLSASALTRLVGELLPIVDERYEKQGDFAVGGRAYSEVRTEIPELIEVITRAARRIKTTVDDLKMYARKKSDELEESVDLNEVLDAAVSLLSSFIKKSTYNLETEKADDLPKIRGNSQRIEQVVVNLLTNACQALPDSSSKIRVSTRFDTSLSKVVLEVQDEGKGIDPENLERITDPFFTTKHDEGGTGLGLSISRTIIENHKGELRFSSEPGKGTVAMISIPLAAAASGQKSKKKDS